ncbi:MAG: choice-of-anchor tandem repeat GloVer-containing protein [Rhizomicrobium sp.]|jgi:uncharacterized repeat protein (TIGR03803 family)
MLTSYKLLRAAALAGAALVSLGAAQANDEQVLYSFTGQADGQQPTAGVTFDDAGNIYGVVTYAGASENCGPSGCGNIYKLAPDGTFTVLHNFNGDGGANPASDLIRDRKTGDFYGSTNAGGAHGAGTVFRFTPDSTVTTLYSFTGGADGYVPEGRLLRDRHGNFYGTTYAGGADAMGVVYRLSAKGKQTVLHSFTGGAKDGAFPTNAGLAMDDAGNLYGMTQFGGSSDYGTVFRIATDGRFKVLHTFIGGTDGRYPASGLIAGKDGTIYGVTQGGGGSDNCTYGCGTVFRLAPDGTLSILHAFTGGADGANPLGTLLQTKSGKLFGTTNDGSKGTVFRLAPDGKEKVLHAFGGSGDGFEPESGITRDDAGNLYGTTNLGGASGLGTVYTISK